MDYDEDELHDLVRQARRDCALDFRDGKTVDVDKVIARIVRKIGLSGQEGAVDIVWREWHKQRDNSRRRREEEDRAGVIYTKGRIRRSPKY